MSGFAYWGVMVPIAPTLEMERRMDETARMQRQNVDPNLRSVSEISGYHIHATDGKIGQLSDVLIEDSDWTLRYLIVNTGNWWQGKEVLISPRSTQSIRWTEHLVYLGVTRDRVRTSPEYDASRPTDIAFDRDMAGHYGPIKLANAA